MTPRKDSTVKLRSLLLSVCHSFSWPGSDHQYTFISPSAVATVASVWKLLLDHVSFMPKRSLSASLASSSMALPGTRCSSLRSAGLL